MIIAELSADHGVKSSFSYLLVDGVLLELTVVLVVHIGGINLVVVTSGAGDLNHLWSESTSTFLQMRRQVEAFGGSTWIMAPAINLYRTKWPGPKKSSRNWMLN
jgi:hypothetical protein